MKKDKARQWMEAAGPAVKATLREKAKDRVLLAALGVMFVLLVVMTISSIAVAAGSVEAPWRLKIRETAAVRGERVTLGEIADVVGEMNPEAWRGLAQTELWTSPPKGERPMIMRREKLAKALGHYLGDMASLCVLPHRLMLQRGGRTLSETELIGVVTKALRKKLSGMEGRLELRDFRLPETMYLKERQSQVKIELVSDPGPGRMGLRLVEVGVGGRELRKVSGSVFLDQWKQVPAASRPLNRDDQLDHADVTFVEKNMAYLRSKVWNGQGGPWRVRRPVGREQVIYEKDLEPLPLVRRGERVRLTYEGDYIKLMVPAEALEDGGFGDKVAVRNMQSDRRVYGEVRDAKTVVVR